MAGEKTVYLICGESGCGKSELVQKMCGELGFKQLISYTTRPCRGEDDIDHIFITEDDVAQYEDDIIARTEINGYTYFATKSQLYECDFYVIDYDGILFLREFDLPDIRFVTVYINVNRDTRQYRAVEIRGDDPAVFAERSLSEHEQFIMMKRKADFDYSICNYDLDKAQLVLGMIMLAESGKDVFGG